jgi:prefoldin subunit 5
LEFDTLSEIAAELQYLRSELAELQHEHLNFLILE